MNKLRHLLPYLGLVVVVSSLACYASGRIFHHPQKMDGADLHLWIHEQLLLTSEQDKKLEPSEQRFASLKKHYSELIRIGNMELAQAILENKGDSTAVSAAVEKIHQAQGALQKATLAHVFEMKPVLNPDQYEKLLNLTANALYQTQDEKSN